MKADDELCLCFHVSWRKVVQFIRNHKVARSSQVSECFGAGTGCGWCRKQIHRLVEEMKDHPIENASVDEWLASRRPSAAAHAAGRMAYLEEKNQNTSG